MFLNFFTKHKSMKTNKDKKKLRIESAKLLSPIIIFILLSTLLFIGCDDDESDDDVDGDEFVIAVEDGFKVEKVADNLTYPTSITWDDEGKMYVAEAGGGLEPEQLAPSRILLVEQGNTTEIANMTNKGVKASVVGLVWHNGKFYITHRADDLTGAVSSVTKDGAVSKIFDGIVDSQSEHQINDIRVGPDGQLYVAAGAAGNSGVMDQSVAPWVMASADVQTTPCQDLVLLGKNFKSPDFRTMDDPDDSVMTGAFMPFGTSSVPGQVIKGVVKCGGSILKFNPDNPENITTHAWGFRNLIGIAWGSDGQMYAAENGYDVRGSRPVNDDTDVSLRITEGVWYGIPDFSAAREPLTDPKFDSPDSLQAGVFVNDDPEQKSLGFVIDHEASGLTPPDPSVVLSRHEANSSPSMIDVAPASWGDLAGHVFVAEWGDLAPPTNPLRGETPAMGYRIVRIDPNTGSMTPFAFNEGPGGPASEQSQEGKGLERPFDVQFGPDEAMYIVDYGVVEIDMSQMPPYVYKEGTGTIWKISREK